MKINFGKGFYRVFTTVSCVTAIYVMGILLTETKYTWFSIITSIAISMICPMVIYLSFFVLEWIVAGFTNYDNYNPSFMRTIIDKFSKINLAAPFLIILILFLFSTLVLCSKINYLESELDKYEVNWSDLVPIDENGNILNKCDKDKK